MDDLETKFKTFNTQLQNTTSSNTHEMKAVYEELLTKCEKYSKTITKLKTYMSKITKEYDKNIELLLQKLEKQKNNPQLKDAITKYNKKIMGYKMKIRDLQEELEKEKAEKSNALQENEYLKKKYQSENCFKNKISKLKTEYETKIKEIIDEVKGMFIWVMVQIMRRKHKIILRIGAGLVLKLRVLRHLLDPVITVM